VARHIGIVACSAEGAALCYTTVCTEAPELMGKKHAHPEVSMHTHPFSDYVRLLDAGKWEGVAALMLSSEDKLAKAGAQLVICPDNTIHRVFDQVAEKAKLPWLHIAEEVAKEAGRRNYKKVGLIGTAMLREMRTNGAGNRGTQTGYRGEGGFRVGGRAATVELYLAAEKVIDPYPTEFGTTSYASVGMRLLTR